LRQTDSNQCIGNTYFSVLGAENLKPKFILIDPKAKITFTSTIQKSRPKKQTRRASGGQIEQERTNHYYKQKQKTITGKQKQDRNYTKKKSQLKL
jgi:hypothetical protein